MTHNTNHLNYDPLLLSIAKTHNEVQEETFKLQRELDKVRQLIQSYNEQEQTLTGAINASKTEEESLLLKYETARETVLSKWSQLSQSYSIDCFWNVLPAEVLAHIFCYLQYREVLHSVALVNRKWNEVVFNNNQIWFTWLSNNKWVWGGSKCILNSVEPPLPTLNKFFNQQAITDNKSTTELTNDSSTSSLKTSSSGLIIGKYPKKDYKDYFVEAAKSERRWKKGEAVYGSFKSGHPSLSCISLDHRCIFSYFSNSTCDLNTEDMITARRSFKIWDIHFSEAPRCVKVCLYLYYFDFIFFHLILSYFILPYFTLLYIISFIYMFILVTIDS